MKRFFLSTLFLPLTIAIGGSALISATRVLAADPEIPVTAPVAPAATHDPSGPAQILPLPAAAGPDQRQIDCMAKVIVHEAGNQGRRGQVAVAQVIRTRLKISGTGRDVCRIVRQPGQFFDVDRYAPPRASATWTNAVAIATETLNGGGDDVVPGALFFHAAGHPMKGRVRVAQIENQVFYR